jgi:hypothetical protein
MAGSLALIRRFVSEDIANEKAANVYGMAWKYHVLFPDVTYRAIVEAISEMIASSKGSGFWDNSGAVRAG